MKLKITMKTPDVITNVLDELERHQHSWWHTYSGFVHLPTLSAQSPPCHLPGRGDTQVPQEAVARLGPIVPCASPCGWRA